MLAKGPSLGPTMASSLPSSITLSTSLYLTFRLTKDCVHGFADTILLGMHKLNGVDGFSARTLDFLHRRFARGFLEGQ
jgi:hypothetical protein